MQLRHGGIATLAPLLCVVLPLEGLQEHALQAERENLPDSG